LFLFGMTTGFALAQTTTATTASTATGTSSVQETAVVTAGLTPESPFYFFDKITEALQGLFAITPEAKVKLQLSFASERVAEAKAMLAIEGDHKEGLDIIHASLVENVQNTANILKQEKNAGKDIAQLAKEANAQFDSEEKNLNNTLAEAHKEVVNIKIEEYKKLLEEAKAIKDEAKISDVEKNLEENKQIAQDLKDKKEEIKKSFHEEKRAIEEQMSEKDQEEDKIDSEQEDIDDTENDNESETDMENESETRIKIEASKTNDSRGNLEVRTEGRIEVRNTNISND
jgi:hypothetical protein